MGVYVTGDLHHEKRELLRRTKVLDENDILIVAGDFGFLWDWNSWGNVEKFLTEEIKCKIYVCLGNHENYDMLWHFPTVGMKNSTWVTQLTDNCFVMARGGVYDLQGLKIYTMGGGDSIDKSRRIVGESWWKEELPSELEYKTSEIMLNKHNRMVDYVVTHTCPINIKQYLRAFGLLSLKLENTDEKELMLYLQKVYETVDFKKWFFGHFHIDAEIDDDIECLYFNVRELKGE